MHGPFLDQLEEPKGAYIEGHWYILVVYNSRDGRRADAVDYV